MFEQAFDTSIMQDDGPRWHPIMLARESPPAHWVFYDSKHEVAGRIELRRTDNGARYRVEHRGHLIGWATSLKLACERLHRVMIQEGVPGGGINGR